MLYQAMQEQYGLLFGMNELFPILSESHLSWDADLVAVEVVGLSAVSPYSLMLFRKMKPLTFVPRIPCVRTKDFV